MPPRFLMPMPFICCRHCTISLVFIVLTGAVISAAAVNRIPIFSDLSNMAGIGATNVPPSVDDQAVMPGAQGFYAHSYCDGMGWTWDLGRTVPGNLATAPHNRLTIGRLRQCGALPPTIIHLPPSEPLNWRST